jgi:hypothetical protein
VKVAGALTTVIGILLGAVLLLLPVQITVLGTTGSCGLPFAEAFQPLDDNSTIDATLTNECIQESKQRALLAIAAGVILVCGGLVLYGIGAHQAAQQTRTLPTGVQAWPPPMPSWPPPPPAPPPVPPTVAWQPPPTPPPPPGTIGTPPLQ